ncbi:hypothetical protein DM02DRAFT_67019 [Periconia macrospinosa]|uniref:Rho-GAP domain-containing protein n=1 Tax=Periconia macrospinosa TaxID=97972 RepID=A0A2V1DIU1_9PLEO|nr:hypothetical protein DM02DRAFT_67019 [Periconia macrospinosa]
MPKSSSLSLTMRSKPGKENSNSPQSPLSPRSPPPATNGGARPHAPHSDVPQSPASTKPRKDSKNIFSNFAATKSSSRLVHTDSPRPDREGHGSIYTNGRGGASTPDLKRPVYTPNSDDVRSESGAFDQSNDNAENGFEAPSSRHGTSKSNKHMGGVGRSRSIKNEEQGRSKLSKTQTPQLSPDPGATWTHNGDNTPLKTAPLDKDKSWRGNMAFGKLRTHSADRHDNSHHPQRVHDDNHSRKDRTDQGSVASGSFNESRGAQLMSNLGFGARKMGEKFDSARKGVFGKLGRSSSNHETQPQVPKEPYQFKIIHTPLVEQTRLTRISSRLEHSKDKTEFWMPALPWRCIDYLNMKGCEEEGLYRVPGAAHQIRYYEQKFDQVRDIDLIAEEDLNDPNVIGSLFKNWLRQLPDEIFPKATQARIQQECQGAKTTPQMLKDELSRLPPFNYYLLFAITCHISLLHSCSEFNKMNYNNLCICFQPAIRIDAFCFQFLILDWRNCWQGCWTEKEYLVEEVKLLEAQENAANPQPTPSRNGHSSGKAKGSQSSAYLGEALKTSSGRSSSADRAKSPSTRGVSSDRSLASGRVTPPNNSSLVGSEKSVISQRGATQRDHSTDRNDSSSDSREPLRIRAESVDEDTAATPTQTQHARAQSSTTSQFRLDLSNPPSSPFNIKF